jgi:hypothetical protein
MAPPRWRLFNPAILPYQGPRAPPLPCTVAVRQPLEHLLRREQAAWTGACGHGRAAWAGAPAAACVLRATDCPPPACMLAQPPGAGLSWTRNAMKNSTTIPENPPEEAQKRARGTPPPPGPLTVVLLHLPPRAQRRRGLGGRRRGGRGRLVRACAGVVNCGRRAAGGGRRRGEVWVRGGGRGWGAGKPWRSRARSLGHALPLACRRQAAGTHPPLPLPRRRPAWRALHLRRVGAAAGWAVLRRAPPCARPTRRRARRDRGAAAAGIAPAASSTPAVPTWRVHGARARRWPLLGASAAGVWMEARLRALSQLPRAYKVALRGKNLAGDASTPQIGVAGRRGSSQRAAERRERGPVWGRTGPGRAMTLRPRPRAPCGASNAAGPRLPARPLRALCHRAAVPPPGGARRPSDAPPAAGAASLHGMRTHGGLACRAARSGGLPAGADCGWVQLAGGRAQQAAALAPSFQVLCYSVGVGISGRCGAKWRCSVQRSRGGGGALLQRWEGGEPGQQDGGSRRRRRSTCAR